MGKPTGFMEFERLEEAYEPVEKRLTHYKEFVQTLSDDQAKTFGKMQAGLVGRYRDDPRLIERDRESQTRRGPELSR